MSHSEDHQVLKYGPLIRIINNQNTHAHHDKNVLPLMTVMSDISVLEDP